MKTRMKTNSFFLLTCIFMALPYFSNGQTVYHVDPNATYGMNPDNMRSTSTTINGIKLTNDYAKDISILLSDNGTSWDTTKIPGSAILSYTSSVKYIRIFTSVNNFVYYKLTSGNAYDIYWNKEKNRWDVK
jgi:hypothetical protein